MTFGLFFGFGIINLFKCQKYVQTSFSTWMKNCLIPSRVSSSFLTKIRIGSRMNLVVTSSTSGGIVADSRITCGVTGTLYSKVIKGEKVLTGSQFVPHKHTSQWSKFYITVKNLYYLLSLHQGISLVFTFGI